MTDDFLNVKMEYKNILSIDCKEKDGKWECIINRRLSDEPKEINKQLCYSTKQESVSVSSVELKENSKICYLHDTGEDKFLRCE